MQGRVAKRLTWQMPATTDFSAIAVRTPPQIGMHLLLGFDTDHNLGRGAAATVTNLYSYWVSVTGSARLPNFIVRSRTRTSRFRR